jgi:diguanylate cyclase (GGDEF)-like protein
MPNRRHLESQFVELHAQAQENGDPITLALFDVDHFKLVNDDYGHFIGDAVLKEIADLFSGSIEPGMLASRFGGEEFALLMPGSDIEIAAGIVEGILDKLADTPMKLDDLTITVTASAGLIAVEDDESWGAAYIACDEALYEAKTSGRNRFIINTRKPHRGSARISDLPEPRRSAQELD